MLLQVTKSCRQQLFHLLVHILRADCVEVAYFQGTKLFETPYFFRLLCTFIRQCRVWSINLGEIQFSSPQLEALASAIENSRVSFMFYECNHLPRKPVDMKRRFRNIIRANRSKHSRWKFSLDRDLNETIMSSEKNW
jgi:hypothetical protein